MHVLKTYEQTGIYDPTNPTQRKREVYVGGTAPGGYASFYWNVAPNDAQLGNVRGLGFWSGLPGWLQYTLIGGAALAAGYFGMKKFGPAIKAKLGR